jgi:hypothetical protein
MEKKREIINLIILFLIALFFAAISCNKITIDPDPQEIRTGKTNDNGGTPFESDTTSGDSVLIGG